MKSVELRSTLRNIRYQWWVSLSLYPPYACFLQIDLAADKIIAAEKPGEKIAVKSFSNDSPMYDFHLALGQFLNYQMTLEENEPDRVLYLAVPLDTYQSFFQRPLPKAAIQRHKLKLIVYRIKKEEIAKWIN
jgi:hypothetical protein